MSATVSPGATGTATDVSEGAAAPTPRARRRPLTRRATTRRLQAEPRARRGPRPAPAPAPREGNAAVMSSAVTMVAIVCLWMVAQMLVLGGLSHDRAQDVLYTDFRADLGSATAPVGPVVPAGDPVALLSIPAIGLNEVVVEGTASGDTLVGPGHRRDTVLPGQLGISLVYGRATTYGGPFAQLGQLSVGDPIDVLTGQGAVSMAVVGVRRDGDPVPAPPGDGVARLTLVSAEGQGRLAALTPDQTIYVDAEASDAFAAPPGRAVAVPEAESAMAADTGALPLLALCLALLLALTLAVVAARTRWSTALVWVIASPLAIAVAWGTTDTVMRLLPNLV